MTETAPLLEPVQLGSLSLRNRIVFGAHTTNLADAGVPGPRMVEYYVERGRGGAALIVVEPMPVSPETRYSKSNLLEIPAALAAYRRLTTEVRATGARVVQQLIHLGAHVDSSIAEAAPVTPQAQPSWIAPQAAVDADAATLARVEQAFVDRAVEARQAGFEGVELFANYQGLLEQDWTAKLGEGGCDGPDGEAALDRACLLSASVCRAIRLRCGPHFVIGMAVSALPPTPGVLTVDSIAAIVSWHDRHGLIDYVSCGSGGYRDTSTIVPSPFQEARIMRGPLSARLRAQGLRARIVVEAGLHDAAAAQRALQEGADLVSLVRPQICDPDWVAHLAAGEPERSRPCTACNQACIGRRARDLWVSCLSNPRAGREHRLDRPQATGPAAASALVLGGGVAGLEAARTLALRGWAVELHEAGPRLGGKLLWMAALPGLERHQALLDWYARELQRLGVNVQLQRRSEPAEALALAHRTSRQALLLATGAMPAPRPLQRAWPQGPQLAQPSAACGPIDDVLRQPPRPGSTLLIVDDLHGHRGLTVACWLQELGVQVTLVTSNPAPGAMLAGAGMQTPLRQRFARAGGRVHADTVLLAWDGRQALLRELLAGQLIEVSVDHLAWSCASVAPAAPLPLGDAAVAVHLVGDAAGERDAEQAILEAHRCALHLPARPARRRDPHSAAGRELTS